MSERDARIAEIENQLAAMEQASKLHPHDWAVLRRVIGVQLAECAQTARLREALENLSRYEAEELEDAPGYFLDWADVKAVLRDLA